MRETLFLIIGATIASIFFLIGTADPREKSEHAQFATAGAATTTILSDYLPQQKLTDYHRVIKVVDGDTVALEIDGTSVTVRLIGINTPETSDPRKSVECFGKEATTALKALLQNAPVRVETDPSQDTYDRYGRLLAYLYLSDGTLVNERMIRDGFGYEYTYDRAYEHQMMFRAAEAHARVSKNGLWADNACPKNSQEPTTRTPTTSTLAATGSIECLKNTYNCGSFRTQAEAQAAFDTCGGVSNDVHKLDSDKDGSVCESLP